MPNTYSQLYYHYIFSPKNRDALITSNFEQNLYKYITGVVKNLNQILIQINGMQDHIHLLVRLKPAIAPSTFIQKVKANSSKWINENNFLVGKFAWQSGGSIFSVDYNRVDEVKKYILNQKEHHKNKTFKEEFIELMDLYKVIYDERYLLEFFD